MIFGTCKTVKLYKVYLNKCDSHELFGAMELGDSHELFGDVD